MQKKKEDCLPLHPTLSQPVDSSKSSLSKGPYLLSPRLPIMSFIRIYFQRSFQSVFSLFSRLRLSVPDRSSFLVPCRNKEPILFYRFFFSGFQPFG